MHSLDRYSGANSRIVRPKNRRVIICDWPANCANRVSSIGSSKTANCVMVRLLGLSGKLNNRAKVIPGNLLGTSFNHHATLSWVEYKGRAGWRGVACNAQETQAAPLHRFRAPVHRRHLEGEEAQPHPAVDTFIV